MHEITPLDCSRIAQDLQIRKVQVESVVGLLDEGNTVPFVTRYRKERTGGLNEEVIRQIQTRVQFLRQLADRKHTILKSIEGQGQLTDQLRQAILKADTVKRLEDLYLPFKPKKRSQASKAREQGLEPLALAIWYSDPAAANLDELLPALVNPEKELKTPEDVRAGVQNILAEMIAETAVVRAIVRSVLWETGKVCAAKSDKLPEGQGLEYKDYFEFGESARQIPPHRILALNRGEKEQALKIRLEWNADAVRQNALGALADHLLQEVGRTPAVKAPAVVQPPPAPPAQRGEATQPIAVEEAALAATGENEVTLATESDAGPTGATAPPAPSPIPVPPPPAEAAPLVASLSVEPKEAKPLPGEPLFSGVGFTSPQSAFLRTVLDDALQRLLLPSLEREIRRELTDEAEGHAVAIFARNLRSLLLQPPLRGKRILAIDPGFRTGCKVAALDEYGNLLEHAVIYPHASPVRKSRDKPAKGVEKSAAAQAPAAEAPPASTFPAEGTAAPPVDAGAVQPPPAPPSQGGETVAPVQPTAATQEVAATSETATTPETAATPEVVAPSNASPAEAAPLAEATAVNPAPAPAAESVAPTLSTVPSVPSADKRAEAKAKLQELVTKHQLQVAALGNGTGCRETEEIIAELIATSLPDLVYVIVNEAGASVYSVSPVGREDFPDFDATLRGTISIGRRLQDPLSELVKVDPQNIGVGLYQHDLGRKELKDSLDAVVESCVNQVGVDLNTASIPLLRHVSGLNQLVARTIVDFRRQHGPFASREALLQIPNLGPARYVQAAGFLKIPVGGNPLDRTWIHPESYPVAEQILTQLGYSPAVLDDKAAQEELQAKLKLVQVEEVAKQLNVGVPTVQDIVQALARPGRDPREDLPPPIFKKGILKLEDLQPGMELKGTVLNVVDFGAFVDIGLKDSGLVHISQMANRYIKSPYDVVAVSDVVTVWVLTVDKERHRVSLTMIKPGTERKPPEKGPRPRREEGSRPPRGRPPVGGQPQGQQPGRPGEPRTGQGRPPRGRGPGRRGPRPGGPPRTPPAQAPVPAAQEGAAPIAAGVAAAGSPPPPPPPRKPRREPPRPKLSQAALEGKVPLRTFAELGALFAAKKEPEKKAPPPEAAAPAAPPAPAPSEPPPPPEMPPSPPAGENAGTPPA